MDDGKKVGQRPVNPEDLDNAVDEAKKDFIAIFGLFAALLIFLSVEVKIFTTTERFGSIMGISFFFLSAILAFAATLHNISHGKHGWSDYWKPPFALSVLFLIASSECFYWVAHGYLWPRWLL